MLETTTRPPAFAERLRANGRAVAIAAVVGIVTGILVGGIASRLAMRVLAATSDPRLRGVLTSDREPIGEITLDGTMSLVLFVGVAGGALLGLAYLVVRNLLPGALRLRAAVYGLLVWCVGAASMFDAEDFDFRVLEPGWLAVGLFSAVFLAAGWVVAAWTEVALGAWPPPDRRSLLRYAPLVLLVPFFPLLGVLALLALLRSIDWRQAQGLWSPARAAARLALVVLALVLAVPALGEVVDIV